MSASSAPAAGAAAGLGNLTMVEKLDGAALESSNGWNNAGTGHSANMELNYTRNQSGRVD